ncbi:MAG: sialidase family protein [Pirellulales bacterium]
MNCGQTRRTGIWRRVAAGVAVVLWAVGSVSTVRSDEPSVVWLDLDSQSQRQVVVDRESGVYLGHPSTLLLEDGRTILSVYPQGHGRGAIVYKRSEDGGLSWSERLPTPANWATSQETPTLFRMTDVGGRRRVVLFSGLYPIRTAISEDDGQHWSELTPVGEWGGIVAMGSMISVRDRPGEYLALFHDDGRYIDGQGGDGGTFTLYSSRSTDGGVTWGRPETIYQSRDVHLCEPGAIRSPDGRQIAVLLRENRRVQNSHVMFSDDEGQTWTVPRPLPATLNGDRHVGRYGPDGRLFISFRDVPPRGQQSPTAGDWVGWVGTYEDLVQGLPGQYRVRLKDNKRQADCAYPGVELLPDGTFVVTTYGHWVEGESPYILSVRFTLSELDQLARTPR